MFIQLTELFFKSFCNSLQVVLPTFILEKRSLLEMFADCMAHPDLFLRIADMKDAELRMMAVLEWYLTSFHAGRKVGLQVNEESLRSLKMSSS